MLGWRARIGYIVPSTGTVTEAEWRRCAPEGVIFVGSRVLIQDVTPAGIQGLISQLERAALEVASAQVDVIVQVGTPAGFVDGRDTSGEIEKRLQDVTGIRTISMMSACLDAFRVLDLGRLVVVTPYVDELNERLRTALEAAGLKICALRGLGVRSNLEINALGSDVPYREVRLALKEAPEADGVFISSGGWPTMDVLDTLERDIQQPVVSSNAAALWKALRTAGLQDRFDSLGTLLALH